MAENDKYIKMFKIVKIAVDELNSNDLLPEAPDDEFDSESREITRKINVNNSIKRLLKLSPVQYLEHLIILVLI